MAADVKTEFKIPDLWFDFYARLIPGTAFITVLRYWSLGINTLPSSTEIFILIGAGYFTGLIFSPFGSRIARLIESYIEYKYSMNKGLEKRWLRKLQYDLGRESRDSLILSKMHGEVTMFVQLGLLTLFFGIQNYFELFPQFKYSQFRISLPSCIFIIVFFVLIAFEIAHRRIIRADDARQFYNAQIQALNSDDQAESENDATKSAG